MESQGEGYKARVREAWTRHRADAENNPRPGVRVQCEDCVGKEVCDECKELTYEYAAVLGSTYTPGDFNWFADRGTRSIS